MENQKFVIVKIPFIPAQLLTTPIINFKKSNGHKIFQKSEHYLRELTTTLKI